MAAPTFFASGTTKANAGSITPEWPANHQTGDIALLVVQTSNQVCTLSAAQGFVEVADSPQGTGTAATAGAVRLTIFWCRATSGSMAGPTIADSGDHQIAKILVFRGCVATGNPWDVTSGNVQASADTSIEVPGDTTTVADTRVVVAVANGTDSATGQFTGGWTNADLTGLANHTNQNTDTGTGGGWAVGSGVKATAGAYGTTTGTLLTSSAQARISIALKSAAAVAPMPTFQAAGTAVSGTGSVTPAWPTHITGDVALLFIESANETISLTTANGFVQVADSPQGTGVAGDALASRLAIYWCRATSSAQASPVVADPGDHVIAQILTFRGCISTGNPWDVTAGDVETSGVTTVSIPGDTTTTDNCLIVAATSTRRDTTSPQFSGPVNASLSNLTEQTDVCTDAGNGGGFAVFTGGKATAGAYSATTATAAQGTQQGRISIALKGEPSAGGGGGSTGGDPLLPHRYWRMLLKNTPGSGPVVNEVEIVERSETAGTIDSLATAPAKAHPAVTHLRPTFRCNQGGDASAVWDADVAYMTIPAGFVASIPTDQVTRTVETFADDDGVLKPTVGQSDGASTLPLVKGIIRGTGRHGDAVTFSDHGRVFQTVPKVSFAGGINHQPASKWGTAAQVDAGTAASAPNTSNPQYEDFSALDLTESGFILSARLRQKGTITARTLNFAGTTLDTVNETDTISTLTNAPANDNRYVVDFSGRARLKSQNGTEFRLYLSWVIETSIDSAATWQVRGSGSFFFSTTSTNFVDQGPINVSVPVNVAGLTADGTDRIRLRLTGIAPVGLGSYVTANTYINGTTVRFNTSSDTFASKTPDTDDIVYWEASGYV